MFATDTYESNGGKVECFESDMVGSIAYIGTTGKCEMYIHTSWFGFQVPTLSVICVYTNIHVHAPAHRRYCATAISGNANEAYLYTIVQ